MTDDLDTRLAQAADSEPDPPPLSDCLERAAVGGSRRTVVQWAWVGAAAAVLALGGGTAALVAVRDPAPPVRSAVASPPAHPVVPTKSPAPTYRGMPYQGGEAWSDPVLRKGDPAVISVTANRAGGPSCVLTPVLRVVSQTKSRVVLVVDTYAKYQDPAQIRPCTSPASPKVLTVRLPAPLGDRALVDAFDHKTKRPK